MSTLHHYLNEFRACISTRNGFLTLCTGVLTCLLIFTLFSDQLHLWPFFRRPTILQISSSIYSDNLVQTDLSQELSSYLPIDVVYTWVNGSDPLLAEQLKEVKSRLEKENNSTLTNTTTAPNPNNSTTNNTDIRFETFLDKNGTCTLSHCVPFNVLVVSYRPGLARAIRRREVMGRLEEDLIEKVIETCESPEVCPETVTLVKMKTVEAVGTALGGNITYNKQNLQAASSFVTSEKVLNSIPLTNYFVISGNNTDTSSVLEFLSTHTSRGSYTIISNNTLSHQTIVVYKVTSESAALKESNSSLFAITPARIIWNPLRVVESIDSDLGDFSSNRFEDNEELRYSLRSVFKYAPWVRHIYIVTNGQIPYWLDLSHPRISIITHAQIFLNTSHLPTFSSPAIESHIHRIPGLSKKFLYMNDDVMFGQPVYPDDFYTERSGQKIYLSWSVPNCHEGCPDSWIGDGYCDKQCNNEECEFDAGDCNKTGSRYSGGGGWGYGRYGGYSQDTSKYCKSGCPNSWLGDRYCDSSCFVIGCGFDSGDCGTEEFFRIHKLTIAKTNSTQIFEIPYGSPSAYFNLSDLFPKHENWTVKSGTFFSNGTVRTTVYSVKHHILTMTFYIDTIIQENSTLLLAVQQSHDKGMFYQLSLNISWALNDTLGAVIFPIPVLGPYKSVEEHISIGNKDFSFKLEKGQVIFDDSPKHSYKQSEFELSPQVLTFLETAPDFPDDVREKFKKFVIQFEEEILTEQGFLHRFNAILKTLPDALVERIENSLAEMSANPDSNSVKGRKLQTVEDLSPSFRSHMHTEDNSTLHSGDGEDREHYNTPVTHHHSRKLLDTFGESLKYVNRKFTKRYGPSPRKVPAHMPHFIDRDVMQELQDVFSEEYQLTSSHQIRHGHDMQYSFAYFYFYLSEKLESIDLVEVFAEYDTDENGLLSVLEQRNLAAQIYSSPLSRNDMNDFDQITTDCSEVFNDSLPILPRGESMSYYGTNLPLIDINFFASCGKLIKHIKKFYSGTSKRKYEIVNEDDIAFKMINENTSRALGHLDWIRKNKRKFICINDNINHASESAHTVKSLIKEFYLSFYPISSPFELPSNYRNRFFYMDEYSQWQSEKSRMDVYFKGFILVTLVLIFVLVFYDKLKRKLCRFDCILLKMFIRKQKKTNYLV